MFTLDTEIQVTGPSDIKIELDYTDDGGNPINLDYVYLEYTFKDNDGHTYRCLHDPFNTQDEHTIHEAGTNRIILLLDGYTLTGRVLCGGKSRVVDSNFEDGYEDTYYPYQYTNIRIVDGNNC